MAQTLNISDIQLLNLLKGKFGEKEAEQFVSLVKDKVDETFENKKDSFATKKDISSLDIKIEGKLSAIELKIAQLEVAMAKTESRRILWAFVFWATQLGAIFAFIKFLIIPK